jgi:hypothetical protein
MLEAVAVQPHMVAHQVLAVLAEEAEPIQHIQVPQVDQMAVVMEPQAWALAEQVEPILVVAVAADGPIMLDQVEQVVQEL